MAGIVFAKLARPKNRTNTILFSNNAVITQRNGHLYLLVSTLGCMIPATGIAEKLKAPFKDHLRPKGLRYSPSKRVPRCDL